MCVCWTTVEAVVAGCWVTSVGSWTLVGNEGLWWFGKVE